ncbi:MAG: radical SAM protein [Pseudomonadota bacterium]
MDASLDRVILTGFGEPRLHPDLVHFLDDLERRRLNYGVTTNGIFVQKAFLDRFASLSLLSHVDISVDSFDPEGYRQLRGGSIAKCFRGIEALVRAGGPQTQITVSSVLMKSTAASMLDAPAQLAQLGIKHFVVQSLFDQSDAGIDEHITGLSHVGEMLTALRSEADRHGVTIHLESEERLRLELERPAEARSKYFTDVREQGFSRACDLPWLALHVDAAGTVFPCCRASAANDAELGSLKDSALPEIWRGQGLEDFREEIGEPETLPGICAECSAVPPGQPTYTLYGAEVIEGRASITERTAVIRVRDSGRCEWAGAMRPRIAVAQPRDRPSAFSDDRWLSPNRPCDMMEDRIGPGEIGHFKLPISFDEATPGEEHFQLVIDGFQWLWGTGFSVSTRAR